MPIILFPAAFQDRQCDTEQAAASHLMKVGQTTNPWRRLFAGCIAPLHMQAETRAPGILPPHGRVKWDTEALVWHTTMAITMLRRGEIMAGLGWKSRALGAAAPPGAAGEKGRERKRRGR